MAELPFSRFVSNPKYFSYESVLSHWPRIGSTRHSFMIVGPLVTCALPAATVSVLLLDSTIIAPSIEHGRKATCPRMARRCNRVQHKKAVEEN